MSLVYVNGTLLLPDLNKMMMMMNNNNRDASCLYQRLSILIQRFNVILLQDSFVQQED